MRRSAAAAEAAGGKGICADDHRLSAEWRVCREESVCPPLCVDRVDALSLPPCWPVQQMATETVDDDGEAMANTELDAAPRSAVPAALSARSALTQHV